MILTNGGGAGVLAVDDLIQSGGKLAPLSDDAHRHSRQGAARPTGRERTRSTSSAMRRPSATPTRSMRCLPTSEGRRAARHQLPDRACLIERCGASRDRGDQARAERGAAAADPDQLARRGCGRGRTAHVPRGLDPDLRVADRCGQRLPLSLAVHQGAGSDDANAAAGDGARRMSPRRRRARSCALPPPPAARC